MQLCQLGFKRGVSISSSIYCTTRNCSKYANYQRNYRYKHKSKTKNYLKWFGASSTMVLSASVVRYMEPKTTTTFSEKFENEGELLEIIYTGFHKWTSQANKSYVFMNKFDKTFAPHFSYAVYRKKYPNEEALEIERQNHTLETYETITSNDFPYHYNRAKNRRKDAFKQIRDEKWQNASDMERRVMYDEMQASKKRERIVKDLRRKRRGTAPKAKEGREGFMTEISEKELSKQYEREAEEYLANRDFDKQREFMLELMECEEAQNNLYIFHLKFLEAWTFPDLLFILISAWNDFGLFNYSTHTQQTLSGIKLINDLEDTQKIHEGDELLIVVNEPNHELKIYFKDNYIPIGADGSSKHITQRNKQKQQLNYAKWIKYCDRQPFRCLLTLKTDLLNECMKVSFLQNSKTCKITTPKQCDIVDVESDLERIKRKYGL